MGKMVRMDGETAKASLSPEPIVLAQIGSDSSQKRSRYRFIKI
jgi:hypothetical protein